MRRSDKPIFKYCSDHKLSPFCCSDHAAEYSYAAMSLINDLLKGRAFIVLIALGLEWILFGYRYFVSGAGLELVPLVKRYLDSAYLSADYYLNDAMTGGSHRLVSTVVIGNIAQALGSVEVSMALIFLVVSYTSIWAVMRLAERWSFNKFELLFCVISAAVFWYLVIPQYSPGNVTQIHAELTANHMARVFLYWAILKAAVGSVYSPILLLCFASLFQPVDALLAYPIIGFTIVAKKISSARDVFKILGPLGACAIGLGLISVVIVLINHQLMFVPWDEAEFKKLILLRYPHHYLPETWHWHVWIFLISFTLIGCYALNVLRERALLYACLGVEILFGIYILLLNWVPGIWLYKLQGAKLLWGNYVIWGLAVSVLIAKKVQQFDMLLRVSNFRKQLVLGAVSISFIVGAAYLVDAGLSTDLKTKVSRSATLLAGGNYRTAKDYYKAKDIQIANWLKDNTPPNALILHAPELNVVRSVAGRASVVLNTLAGFSPSLGGEYLRRREALTDYCLNTESALMALAEKYGAQIIVVKRECGRNFENDDEWLEVGRDWLVKRTSIIIS